MDQEDRQEEKCFGLCISSKKVVDVLLGNLTSFSPKMESYLFKPKVAKSVEIFGLIEAHKTLADFDSLKSKFKRFGRDVNLNGAQPTGRSEDGTHGGELASAKSDIDFQYFKDSVIKQIETETGDTVHFSGGILRMKTILLFLCLRILSVLFG